MDVSSLVAAVLSPILLVALFISILFFTKRRSPPPSGSDVRRLPPSPWGLPLLGHLPLLGPLPHRKLKSLAEAHGPVMLLRLGRVPTVVASSAAAAHEAMKTRDLAFASRARVRMADRLLYGRDLVFAPYGEYWRQARRVSVLHLLSPRRVLAFRAVRAQEVAALLDRVRHSPPAPGGAMNLSDALISYANAVIKRAAFGDDKGYGIEGDEGGEKLREVFAEFEGLLGTATVGEFVPWLAWADSYLMPGLDARVARTFEVLDGLLEKVIAGHRERRRRLGGAGRIDAGDGDDDDRRDFVDVLLDVSDTGEEAGFDTIGIKAIILDMFGAATDTTYTTLEWAMAELINHPPKMRKLQDEIRQAAATATANGAGRITEAHLGKLRYLRAVLKETLRLHAPVPLLVPRETLQDTELLGYRVPAGTRVMINAWAIGRDPTAWERAEEFLPERFLEDGPAEYAVVGQNDDFRFVPFGAGRRGCPGVGFAVPSMELALASLLYNFDWELPRQEYQGGGGLSKVDMSELNGLSVRLKTTLRLVATPWSPP